MKKRLLEKALAAFFLVAASACFVNLQGQVNLSFAQDSGYIGNSSTGTIAPLTLHFTINDVGTISLDAFSANEDSLVMGVVDLWDRDSVGTTDVESIFGYSFALVVTPEGGDRLQSRGDYGGGLGVRGKNQSRIDNAGTEFVHFQLLGEVGLEFTQFAYNSANSGAYGQPNFRFIDHDSEITYFVDQPAANDTIFTLPAGDLSIRNSLDSLTVSTCDTLSTGDGNEGGALYGLTFNVVEAAPKPLPPGQVAINFTNTSGIDVGGTPTGGLDPLTLDFTIDATGTISLDASTGNDNPDVVAVVDSWDRDTVGSTDNADFFNQTFSLEVESPQRIQCAKEGGLGIQGRNQWRFDDGIAQDEQATFTLSGEVGLQFISFKYNSLASGDDNLGNLRFIDYDSDNDYILRAPELFPYSEFMLPEGDISMRYKTDEVTVMVSDTLGTGNEGARLYGLVFNLVEALPKVPAVLSTTPAHADTLAPVTSDYVILFDAPMDQATSAAAISFSPEVSNRVDAWNEAGDELTISFDDLSLYTVYTVTIGAGITGSNGLSALSDSVFMFQTLPEPPTVEYTYPVQLGKQLPLNTPIAVQFSHPMIPDSVENAISFDPELAGVGFVWSEDQTLVYMISDEMESAWYEVTISTDATSAYGLQMTEPYTFSFNTWPVSIENELQSDVAIYPNPASDIFQVRGVDVASVKIYSLTGRLMKEVYNSAVIHVSDMEPGSYAVIISDRADNRIRKMIVID
jgi:hypothetical protein